MGEEKTIKLEKIIELNQALDLIIDNTNLSGRLSYKLGRLKSRVEMVGQKFDEIRTRMIREKYGMRLDNGDYKVPQERMIEFNHAIQEVLAVDETIRFPEFSFEEFEQVPGISPRFFALFSQYFTDEVEEGKEAKEEFEKSA